MKNMMKLVVVVLATFLLNACNESDITDDRLKPTGLKIRLHDFPIADQDVQKVIVDITGVDVHNADKGWVTLPFEAKQYDLLELQNGTSVVIMETPLEIGQYTQIRLHVSENNEVYVKGRPYQLRVPSGVSTGVKLITPFRITEGKMVEVTLDFDVEHSVKLVKGKGFRLTPVIKVDSITEYDGVGIVTVADGGAIGTLDGDLYVTVPPDATNENIVLSMNEVDPDDYQGQLPERTYWAGKVYDLSPDGYTFRKPVTLEFMYDEAMINSLGAEENLYVVTFNSQTGTWEPVPSTVVTSANVVRAEVQHFSPWGIVMPVTCHDGKKGPDEEGVDCGGVCSITCMSCADESVLAGNNPSGSGHMAGVYSFGNDAVKVAARSALEEYALFLGKTPSSDWVTLINQFTADEKIEAVSRYVHRHMAYDPDDGEVDATAIILPLSSWGISDISDGLSDLGDSISDAANDLTDSVSDLGGNLVDSLSDLGDITLDALTDTVTDALDSAWTSMVDLSVDLVGALAALNELFCDLTAELSVPIDQLPLDPLVEFFEDKLYEHIEGLYPDFAPSSAAFTATSSVDSRVCRNIQPYGGGSTLYCGDCEDFAVFRSSLLRHVGVASQCIMNMDYHASSLYGASGKAVAINAGATGRPAPYDYETAENLFQAGGGDSDGHTFNVVFYQSKYRIMDYGMVKRGEYAFESTDPDGNQHKGDHVWNDQFGRYWVPELTRVGIPTAITPNCIDYSNFDLTDLTETLGVTLSYTSPGDKTRNYHGGPACYEENHGSWTYKTLYSDVCP